jgi:Uma2 family endonuclease
MSTVNKPRALISVAYEKAAQEYLRSLPLEHFMEATSQATQREITLESLALVHARRPEVHVFNELLVQYPVRGKKKPGQVVPDNMVVVSKEPIKAESNFATPLEPERPFWVLEYVSRSNPRKDYEDSFHKYEHDLKVPYYLIFHPDDEDLRLYRHTRGKYVLVKANEHGRLPIPRLEIEVALLDGWVRFWHKGTLLPLPGELERDLETARREAEQLRRRADEERQGRLAAERTAEELRRQLEQLQGRKPE